LVPAKLEIFSYFFLSEVKEGRRQRAEKKAEGRRQGAEGN
jgi:hypothetical protein